MLALKSADVKQSCLDYARQLRWLLATALLVNVLGLSSSGAESRIPTGPTVVHSPAQPRSGQPVTVSANLPQFDTATLQLQVVSPGAYIRRTDPQFQNTWRDFPMEKHGSSFMTIIPGEFQKHRTLLRYRIKGAAKNSKAPAYYPPATNPVPNYSWFVYDQLPVWKGSSRPGRSPELTFSPEFLATLPTYHLIAHADDVKNSQWNHAANRKPFLGTLIYDGRVYDHITYHNRGQASTYVSGKNKWGLKFNPGAPFHARDINGKAYAYPWTGFNMNPCASAWAQVNRGMAGMDEALSSRAYQLAAVPSPDTFWIHFRVIDQADESPTNQYNSDLWGLYLIVQEKNGTWLRERKLLDGSIYSIDSGAKHLAKNSASREFQKARSASQSPQSEEWWCANLDLPAYYSFHALNRFLANIDLRPDGNHYLYFPPDGRVVVLPHDLDMMLIPKHHQPGYVNQSACLQQPALKIEYQARAREILDLFASNAAPDGGQVGQLVAELSRHLQPRRHERNWAELDEAMWNWHPRSQHKGQFNVTPYEDHRFGGRWTRTLATPDFSGFCKYILDFCTDTRPRKNFRPNDGNPLGYGYSYLAHEAKDGKIPDRPEIRFTGPKNYPSAKLSFTASAFSSPESAKAASIQWRIAQISAPGLKGHVRGEPWRYEIETLWSSGDLPAATSTIQIPAGTAVAGRTYRVRARYKDETGRCSHWSPPIQFVASGN